MQLEVMEGTAISRLIGPFFHPIAPANEKDALRLDRAWGEGALLHRSG